ncbi:uncharacterized protein NPIL_414921, partial [Nephila pilipes]
MINQEVVNAVQTRSQTEAKKKGNDSSKINVVEKGEGAIIISPENNNQISIPALQKDIPELVLMKINWEDFIKAQKDHGDLKTIYEQVLSQTTALDKSYSLVDELLVKNREDKLGNMVKLLFTSFFNYWCFKMNYRGYSPPTPNFSPRVRHHHPIFPNQPMMGPRRSPNYEDLFYRRERLRHHSSYFEENSPLPSMRQAFRDEESNTYRPNPQFRYSREDDIYVKDRLRETEERLHLQYSSSRNYNDNCVDNVSGLYSSANKLNDKDPLFSNLERNLSLRQSRCSGFSNNTFPRQNAPCDIPSSSNSFNNFQSYNRNVDSFQNDPSFSKLESISNKVITSPIYSKNNSYSNQDTFLEKQSLAVPFLHKENLISDDLYANKSNPMKQPSLIDSEFLECIKNTEEQQRRLNELDEKVSITSEIMHSPNHISIEKSKSYDVSPTFCMNQILSNDVYQLKNISNLKFQPGILGEKESSLPDQSYKFQDKNVNSISKNCAPSESKDLDKNITPSFESAVEDTCFESNISFENIKKSEIVPDSNDKIDSNIANNKLNENFDTSSCEVSIQMPIEHDEKTDILLNEEKKIINSNGNCIVEEKVNTSAHNWLDKSSEAKSKIFETNNAVTNSPCKKLSDANSEINQEILQNGSQVSVESLSSSDWSKTDSIPFLEAPDSQLVSSPPRFSRKSTDDPLPVKSAAASETAQICSGESSINGSVLEHAIASLGIYSPIVGLDFIIEDKRSLLVEGSFPFRCKLCNSSIARTLILDHILGSKHRLRYVKMKDEATYDRIMHLNDQDAKNGKIFEAAANLEIEFGRGTVVVSLVSSSKGVKSVPTINLDEIDHNHMDKNFKSSGSSDMDSLKTVDDKEIKTEDQILTNFTKSLENKLQNTEYMSSISSSYSSELISDQDDETLVNDEKITQDFKLNEMFHSKSEVHSNINEQASLSMHSSFSEIDHHSKLSNIHSAIKRTSSPFELDLSKRLKNEPLKYESKDINVNTFKDANVQTSFDPELLSAAITEHESQSGFFNSSLLEHLSKCNISSDDEANIVLRSVDVLLKLLLRYKLKDHANIDVENLMSTLTNCKSSSELSKILDLLKGKKLSEDKNISNPAVQYMMEIENANEHPSKHETILQMSNVPCSSKLQEITLSSTETKNVNSIQGMCTNAQNLEYDIQAMGSNSDLIPSTMNASQASKASWLQPPPFFDWPNSSNVMTSTNSPVTMAQSGQNNIIWSSPYQSNLAYYQQPGYGIPLYQSCIPILPLMTSRSMRLFPQRKRVPPSPKSRVPLTRHPTTVVRLPSPSDTQSPRPPISGISLTPSSLTSEAPLPPLPTSEAPLPPPPTSEAPLPPPPTSDAPLPPLPTSEAPLPPPPTSEAPLPPPMRSTSLPPPPIPGAPLPPPPIP